MNCYIFKNATPPPVEWLVQISKCELNRGTRDKVRLLRSVRGIHFKRATPEEILLSAGIITIGNGRFYGHSAFFFRRNGKTYAVNAQMEADRLVHPIGIKKFLSDSGELLANQEHWLVL